MTTKKELRWRFKELPTAGEVADLVAQDVITKVEARDLLFNDKTKIDVSEENKALKEQIEFLQDTVDKLIDKLSQSTREYRFVNTYTPHYPTRYWLGNDVIATGSGSSGTVIGKYSDSNYTMSVGTNSVSLSASSELIDNSKLN